MNDIMQIKQTSKSLVALSFFLIAVMCCCTTDSEKKSEMTVKVKTMEVGASFCSGTQTYSGVIEEWDGTTLSFAAGGTITHIYVNEGQSVGRGQLIATVDSRNTASGANASHAATEQADDMVQQAQAALNQAQDAYNRMKILHDNGSLPEIKWIEVETKLQQAKLMVSQAKSNASAARSTENIARKSVADTRLYAPTSGYISTKMCDVGQNVMPGAPVVKLVQINRVKVSVSIPENEISHIHNGQTIAVSVAALGHKHFTAKVIEKGVVADPLSRTYMVKALIENPNHELLPGMIAEVTMASSSSSENIGAATLPATIIQIDADNKPFVWTVVDGRAEKTYIELGQNIGDEVQITSGLQMGDRVICEGQQKVSTDMKVTE